MAIYLVCGKLTVKYVGRRGGCFLTIVHGGIFRPKRWLVLTTTDQCGHIPVQYIHSIGRLPFLFFLDRVACLFYTLR